MYNTKLHDTYNRLRNGDTKLLKIMDEIVEYQVTDGRKQSHVMTYLNTEGTVIRYIVYIILLFTLAFGTTLMFNSINLVSDSVIPLAVSASIVCYALYHIFSLYKYLKLAEDYKNVMAYVRTLDPEMLKNSYYDYINNNK